MNLDFDDPNFVLDPKTELLAIHNQQLLMEARNGGCVEYMLTDEDFRDPTEGITFLFDINTQDMISGNTPLHYAVRSGCVENVNHLIEAEGCDVDPQNYKGDTPLHLAVQIKDPKIRREMVFLLVETAGATDSIRIKNRAGQTPNDLAKIYFPNDTEVSSLTTPPARQIRDILNKDDIASVGEDD